MTTPTGDRATYDIGIVGGGIIASAIALSLADQRKSVVLIRDPNGGKNMASRAAGALFGIFSECSSEDSDEKIDIDVSSRILASKMYDNWVSSISERSQQAVTRTRGLFVIANAAGDNDLKELDTIRRVANRFNGMVEDVSPDKIPGIHPRRGFSPHTAIFLRDEGTVDTSELLSALNICIKEHKNITVVDSVAVHLSDEEESPTITCQSGQSINCREAILAGGAMMTRLLAGSERLMAELPPIFAGRGTGLNINTDVSLPHCVRTPNRGFACGIHVVPRGNGSIYLGATNRLTTSPERGESPTVSEVSNLLSGGINEINSNFARAELLSFSIGYRPVTIDNLPIVGRTAAGKILLATGTYRNGILLAPLIAKLISEEVLNPGVHEHHPFSPKRQLDVKHTNKLDGWVGQVSKSLMETLTEPGGSLPYNRDEELQSFIKVVLGTLLSKDGRRFEQLSGKAKRLLSSAPMAETAPLLFELIMRHKYDKEES